MHVYGRRTRGGGKNQAGVAAQYSFVALYNDSPAGHILRVLDWTVYCGNATDTVQFFNQGSVGTLVGRGIALFSGEQDMAGQIFSGSDANAPPFGLVMFPANTQMIAPEVRPWFYLRPGFALVFKTDAVNQAVVVSFWWEDLQIEMLDPCELL